MPRYAFILQYDGTGFSGWQKQPGNRTIQGEIEHAFSIIFGADVSILGAGRTDAGVHANEMVFHVDLHESIPVSRKLLKSLNALTPRNINVRDVYRVGNDFHARFDAKSRVYTYQIAEEYDVFTDAYTWVIPSRLRCIQEMEEVAAYVEGTHDFASFCKYNPDVNNTICNVNKSSFTVSPNGHYVYTIQANRFLHSMVRCLVGAIVQIGQDKITRSIFLDRLNNPDFKSPRYLAPPHALFLKRIHYDMAEWEKLA